MEERQDPLPDIQQELFAKIGGWSNARRLPWNSPFPPSRWGKHLISVQGHAENSHPSRFRKCLSRGFPFILRPYTMGLDNHRVGLSGGVDV